MRKITFLVLLGFVLSTCSACFGYNAVITWSKVPDGDLGGYTIYQSSNGVKYKKIATVQPTATKIILHNQSKYVNAYWYVKSFDINGNESKPSNIVKYIH